jgi:hypothetical protein
MQVHATYYGTWIRQRRIQVYWTERLVHTWNWKGQRRIPTCVWIQNKPGLTVQLHFATEKWKWHAGHGCMRPDPVIVSCLERDGMIMLVDYCEFFVRQ